MASVEEAEALIANVPIVLHQDPRDTRSECLAQAHNILMQNPRNDCDVFDLIRLAQYIETGEVER